MQYYKRWCAKLSKIIFNKLLTSKIIFNKFLTSFQVPSASMVGEIKDASWSRGVTSVIFWPVVIWNGINVYTNTFGSWLVWGYNKLSNGVMINCNYLKVHWCRYEILLISSPSHKIICLRFRIVSPFTFWKIQTRHIWNVCLQTYRNNRIC